MRNQDLKIHINDDFYKSSEKNIRRKFILNFNLISDE